MCKCFLLNLKTLNSVSSLVEREKLQLHESFPVWEPCQPELMVPVRGILPASEVMNPRAGHGSMFCDLVCFAHFAVLPHSEPWLWPIDHPEREPKPEQMGEVKRTN